MLEERKIPRLYMMAAVGVLTLVNLFLLLGAGVPLAAAGLIVAITNGAFIYFGHMLTPMLTKLLKVRYVKGEYEFIPGQDAIVKRIGSKFMAAKFILLGIPERTEVVSEMGERRDVYMRDFENAIATIKVPVKVNMLVVGKDVSAYRESIQAKIYECSLRIKREMEKAEPDMIRIEKWQSEKEKYENLLRRLSSGSKPMAVVMYAMTVAKGVTKKEAVDRAAAQVREIKAVLANNLNVDVADLIGEDAELCLDWEFALPADYKDLLKMTG